jgi:hypothetical protein
MSQLYHYSHKLYSTLLTRTAQKQKKKKLTVNDRKYDDHISFFIEPIPLDILPGLHKFEHPFYRDGSKVYEYCIHTTTLGKFYYELVESPEKTNIYYDNSLSDDEYHKLLKQIEKDNNYTGTSLSELNKLINKFKGKTRRYFQLIPKRPNYEDIKTKYAPTVPHFMIYPESGEVKYYKVTEKIMGNNSVIKKW